MPDRPTERTHLSRASQDSGGCSGPHLRDQSILIAIPTLGTRNIRGLLTELQVQAEQVPSPVQLLVIHNSPAASPQLRHTVLAGGADYQHADRMGYASARNAALDSLATHHALIFIDDDEIPNPHWLASHLKCLQEWEADVVFGPVATVVPPSAPAWLDGGVLLRGVQKRPTGPTSAHVYSGNTTIRGAFLRAHTVRFNEAFNTTGSEDTEFFIRCREYGAMVVWCEDASVLEIADRERMTLTGFTRRTFRRGKTSTAVRVTILHESWLPILIRKLGQLGWASIRILVGQMAFQPRLKGRGYRDFALAIGGIVSIAVKAGDIPQLRTHFRSRRSRNRL